MKGLFPVSLQNKTALLLGFIVSLALSVSGLHSLRVLDDSLRQSVFSGIRFASEHIADSVAKFLDDSRRDIENIAVALPMDALERGDVAVLEKYLKSIAERYPKYQNGLYLLDVEGRLMVDFPPYPAKRGGDYAFREYFIRTMHERRGIIGKPYRSSRTGEPVVTFTAYLTGPAGECLGVMEGASC